MDRDKAGFAVVLEVEFRDRIPRVELSNTSAGAAGRGYPIPTQHDDKVRVRVTESTPDEVEMECLINHINE